MPDEEEAAGSARDHQQRLSRSDPVAQALVEAIHAGEVGSLTVLLREHPGLASARLVDDKGGSGTPLHAVTDWPGYFPHGPEVAATLIDAGADPNASVEGSWHAETPLHWAASSDDVEVARALIDGGADIEATGASIAGGTPLDDAVGYGCWQVVAAVPGCEEVSQTRHLIRHQQVVAPSSSSAPSFRLAPDPCTYRWRFRPGAGQASVRA